MNRFLGAVVLALLVGAPLAASAKAPSKAPSKAAALKAARAWLQAVQVGDEAKIVGLSRLPFWDGFGNGVCSQKTTIEDLAICIRHGVPFDEGEAIELRPLTAAKAKRLAPGEDKRRVAKLAKKGHTFVEGVVGTTPMLLAVTAARHGAVVDGVVDLGDTYDDP